MGDIYLLVTKGERSASTKADMAIIALDLSMVGQRLASKGWKASRIGTALEGYRAFLSVVAGGEMVRPEPDVDVVWHEHILHTKRYEDDCNAVFGGFLHHNPDGADAFICTPTVQARSVGEPTVEAGKPLCIPTVTSVVEAGKPLCIPTVAH